MIKFIELYIASHFGLLRYNYSLIHKTNDTFLFPTLAKIHFDLLDSDLFQRNRKCCILYISIFLKVFMVPSFLILQGSIGCFNIRRISTRQT